MYISKFWCLLFMTMFYHHPTDALHVANYMTEIRIKDVVQNCRGVVVSDRWILTSYACMKTSGSLGNTFVDAADKANRNIGVDDIKRINVVTLLRLIKPFQAAHQHNVSFPRHCKFPKRCYTIGYSTQLPHRIEVDVYPAIYACDRFVDWRVKGYQQQSDACRYNLGIPLLCNDELVGLLTYNDDGNDDNSNTCNFTNLYYYNLYMSLDQIKQTIGIMAGESTVNIYSSAIQANTASNGGITVCCFLLVLLLAF